jgi:hypothetical protein
MGDADVTFGDPTTVVDGTIHVVDNNLALPGEPVAFSDDGSVEVSKTFDCTGVEYTDGHGSYTFENTATIQETDQSDSASVTVDCYQLDVTKDADESRTRTWNWTIDKVVDPDSWSLFDGDTGTSDYTITVDKVDFTDSDFHVEGSITIDNPNPSRSATLTGVTDSISGFGAATVDCPALTVPAGGSLVCTYEADLPDGTTRTNTATATQQNYDFASDGTPTEDGTTTAGWPPSTSPARPRTRSMPPSTSSTTTWRCRASRSRSVTTGQWRSARPSTARASSTPTATAATRSTTPPASRRPGRMTRPW